MRTIILIFSFLLLISCRNDDNDTFQSSEVTFTEIDKGALYGNGLEGIEQSNLVITNSTDWQNLINQMNSVNHVTDEFSETDIDFENYEVIAIFLELKENGWEVEISDITENESDITVTKSETEFVNSVMTQPFHIVKIPVIHKPIVFE